MPFGGGAALFGACCCDELVAIGHSGPGETLEHLTRRGSAGEDGSDSKSGRVGDGDGDRRLGQRGPVAEYLAHLRHNGVIANSDQGPAAGHHANDGGRISPGRPETNSVGEAGAGTTAGTAPSVSR